MEIRLGHSPDADDAFMFFPLAQGKVPTGEYVFHHELQDIETLNRRTMKGELDVSAISIHAYPYIEETYALLSCGASVGEGYGPLVVTRGEVTLRDLTRGAKVAVPGALTTAFLALKLMVKDVKYVERPFDEIGQAVLSGDVEAGVIIHEGQLTYGDEGLVKLVDLGEWWLEETGLPLPLGGNVIRKDLGAEHLARIAGILKESFAYALANREPGVAHAMEYARGLSRDQAGRFVDMYVNDYTLDFGERGREAVVRLLERGYEEGIISRRPRVEFVG